MKNRIKRHLIPGAKRLIPAWYKPLLDVLALGANGPYVHIDVHPNGHIIVSWTDESSHYRIVISLDSGATSTFTKTKRISYGC
jgi:hypothetical protein